MAGFQSDKRSAMTPPSQDVSALKNKRGRMDGEGKPVKTRRTVTLDTALQRMHPNNENEGKISKFTNKIWNK